MAKLRIHEHHITSGPRSHRTGNWPPGKGSEIVHSHEGGDVPHSHPETGPASFLLTKPKFTARATGEQFPYVKTPESELFFDVFVLDSAKVNDHTPTKKKPFGALRPIRPEDEIGLPLQASIIERKFGMHARIHDLRTGRRQREG
jgi:hypothetical protein